MGGCCNWPWEQSCVTDQNCVNPPNNCGSSSSSTCESLLVAFPGTRTCAEAVEKLAQRLGKRIHSKVIVTRSSNLSYVMSATKNRQRIQFTVNVTNPCSLPLTVTSLVGCNSTASASFGTVDQFLSWAQEVVK